MNRRLEMAMVGLAGGLVGLAARRIVDLVWVRLVRSDEVTRPGRHRSWALVGEHHAVGEPPTQALARIVYERIVGRPPTERVKRALGDAVHRAFALSMAALYAATRNSRRPPTTQSGVLFGAAVWAGAAELALPLLGLSEPPTAFRARRHLQMLADHLAYGAAVGATTERLAAAVLDHRRDALGNAGRRAQQAVARLRTRIFNGRTS